MLTWQVMISPEADPPVCRIVDYSKFRYEQARTKARLCGGFSAAR
jgi:translation initiation factor IF-3